MCVFVFVEGLWCREKGEARIQHTVKQPQWQPSSLATERRECVCLCQRCLPPRLLFALHATCLLPFLETFVFSGCDFNRRKPIHQLRRFMGRVLHDPKFRKPGVCHATIKLLTESYVCVCARLFVCVCLCVCVCL